MQTACRPSRVWVAVLAVGAAAAFAAPRATPDADAIARIRDEGLNRSQVSQTAEYLCDVIGPRLTASPGVRRANDWTRQTLTDWGLADAHLEPWGPFGRGWEVESFSVRINGPQTFLPVAAAKAWSGGFDRPVTARIVYLDAKTEAGLEAYRDKVRGAVVLIGQPRATPAKYEPQAVRMADDRLAALAGLPLYTKRATLDLMQPATTQSATTAAATQAATTYPTSGPALVFDPASTRPTTGPTTGPASRAAATRVARINTTQNDLGPATRRARRGPTTAAGPRPTTGPTDLAAAGFATKALAFAAKNGAACVMTPSTAGDGGTLFVTQAALDDTTPRRGPGGATTQPRVWWPGTRVLPQIMTTAEDFNRLVSLARHGIDATATIDLKVRYTDTMPQQYNTIAELPGSDLAEQVVMCGGHLDSWHSGTGATDNAAGVVVAMEAVRILKAAGLQPRRTVRVALWTGEEQGLHGSSNHVKNNYATLSTDPENRPTTGPAGATAGGPAVSPATTPATEPAATAPLAVGNVTATKPAATQATVVKVGPAYDRFSVYFNLDNGTGRIRGIYGENNAGAIALFKEWVKPLSDLGCTTVTTDTTGSTDHVCFNRVGLPGFQFIQDPIEYWTRTHHSNADVFERLQIDDLKQASVVMATFLYNASMTDEPMPRKALGK